jgi:hypothetical protein
LFLAGWGSSDAPARNKCEPASAGTSTWDAYLHSDWLLASVSQGSTTVSIPASFAAVLSFPSPDEILMSDGVNAIDGKLTLTPTGFTTSNVGTTLTGYVGPDPRRLLTIRAMAAVTGSYVGVPATHAVQVRIADGQLRVDTAGYDLTFQRRAPGRPPSGSPPPRAS